MATKRYNVPQYMKNVKKSAGYMAKNIAYTYMPSLSSTIVSTRAAYSDIRDFAMKERSRINMQKKYQTNSLLRPVKEIIINAKNDIKTGKFYNEERLKEAETESMSDFLGEMSGDNEETYESSNSISLAPFDKILASSSAHSMSSAKAISETQVKTTEYLGELHQSTHMQNLVINQKHHLEHMTRLDNIEKIGTSLVEFNVKTMNEHIKATHSFYEEILNETRELKKSIDKISKNVTARYGSGNNKNIKKNVLSNIFGGGAFDIGGYEAAVKNNLSDQIPFTGDMMKDMFNNFKASPISALAMMASSFMIPKGFKSGASKIDKSVQGMFSQYLQMMSNWKSGKTNGKLGDLKQILGNILSVDMNTNPRPDLSQYKNKALDLELEQKKAKAITEVIPQYLSEITNKLTGKNMFYNYNKGFFEDRNTARGKLDKDKKSSVVYTMDETKQHFDSKIKGVANEFAIDDASKAVLYEDIDNFVFWLATNGTEFNPKRNKNDSDYYIELNKLGLKLKGGLNSYKIIKAIYLKSSPAQRMTMKAERVNANAMSRDIIQRFNDDIISSGASSLYNGMDTLPKESSGSVKFNKDYMSIVNYIANQNLSEDELKAFKREYENKKKKDLNIKDNDTASYSKFANNMKNKSGKILDKLGLSDLIGSVKGVLTGISEVVEEKLSFVADKMSSGIETVASGSEDDVFEGDFEYEEPSAVKTKAKKVSAKIISAGKSTNKKSVKHSSNGNSYIKNMMKSSMDYRPYFDKIDSHLRNIATLTERNNSVTISYGQAGMPVLVESVNGVFAQGSRPDGIDAPNNGIGNKNSNLNTIKTAFRKAVETGKEGAKTLAGKGSELFSKAKSKGFEILKTIGSGILEHGGNVKEYFQSDKFKETIGGITSTIKSGANTAKTFAGTLFESLKNMAKGAFKKGKGIAIGSLVSNMLGLGPIPGAVIGALFSKKKKTESDSEDKETMDNIEKQEKGGGFLDKFKGKKKKSVLMGSAVSTLLGLGPVPGALVTMIYNKKFVKKNQEEDKEAKEMSEGIENAEKEAKGLSKFKKGKNLVGGAAISSLLGLGPMPGILTASIYNKFKDKSLKKKNSEDEKQGEETAEAMNKATNQKEGILAKVKRFLGKGKNLAIGAAASSLLGLGPIPGVIVASMYNKKKYKKKQDETETEEVKNSEEVLKDEVSDNAEKEINKTSVKNNRKKKRKHKKALQTAERRYSAESKGNQKEADRLEKQELNKAKATGDIDEIDKTSSIVANMRNSVTGSPSGKSDNPKNPEKKNIFDSLKGILGGIGNVLSFLGPISLGLLGIFASKSIKDWIKYMKENGAGGHNTKNEQGDSNFVNWTDNVDQSANTAGTLSSGAVIKGLSIGASKILGIKSGPMASSFMGMSQSFNTSKYYKNEQEAYNDRGAETLGQEASGLKWQNRAKGVWYGAKFAKTTAKVGEKISTSSLGSKLISWATKLVSSPKIVKFFEKTGLKKAPAAVINFFKKNSSKIMLKISTKAPKFLSKIAIKIGSIASVVAAWLPLITAIAAFVRGWNNAARDLGMDPDSKIFIRARIANALVYALDDVLCGVLDIIGLRDWLTQQFTILLLSDEEEKELQSSKTSQLNKYEKFIKDNNLNREGFTFDMYNKMTNKSIWGNVKSWFGADDLKKYKTGGKENTKLRDKYGGYTQNVVNYDASQSTNVLVQDGVGGSGGRGIEITSKSSKDQVLKYAHDKLKNSLYAGNATKLTENQVDQVQKVASANKSNTNTESKSGSFFSNIGKSLSTAASWVKSGLGNIWSWVKDKFTGWFGSGGRGNTVNQNNYYNQADPRWANQSFGKYGGKRDTIKEGGCGPTVAAMALQQLTGNEVLPSTMANLALKAGYKVDDGGTSPEFFNTAGSMYGYNFNTESGINNNTVSALKAGVPVPLLGKSGPYGNGTHYLLANKIDSSGNVSVLDPQNKNNNKKYPIGILASTTNASMVVSPSIGKISKQARSNKYVQQVKSIGRGPTFGPNTELYADKKEIRKAGRNKRLGRGRYGRGPVISQTLLTSGYETRSSRDIKYIVIHYAANFDGKAAGAKNWYNGKEVSAHYAVGTDGIYQTVDDKNVAWHCGGEVYSTSKQYGGASLNGICTNSNSIGIELASNSSTNDYSGPYWFDEATLTNAVALVNSLMSKYNISKDNVVRHFDTTGKPCPAPMVPKAYLEKSITVASNHDDNAWNNFKNRLSGVASKATVGEALVQGMAALENRLSYSQSQRDVAKGSSDCSGTVQWVYKKVCGVDPGGNTSSMKSNGTQILASTSDVNNIISSAQPGDLLLFSGHVEMYAGNGQCWGHGGGSDGSIPGTRKTSVSGYVQSSGACQVRRYITGSETINTNLGTITDKDGNSVEIKISGTSTGNVYVQGSTQSEGQTMLQRLLSAVTTDSEHSFYKTTDPESPYYKFKSALEGITGTVIASAASTNKVGSVSGKTPNGGTGAANYNVTEFSSVTADKLKEAIRNYTGKENSWMEGQVDNIMEASKQTGIDPRFMVVMAAGENGWNGDTALAKANNMINIGAYDSDPMNGLNYGNATPLEGWINGFKWLKENYIEKYGQNTLHSMKNPTSVGAPDWHSYQTGPIDPKVKIYDSLVNSTGGRGSNNNVSVLPYKLKNKINKEISYDTPFVDSMIGRGTGTIGRPTTPNASKSIVSLDTNKIATLKQQIQTKNITNKSAIGESQSSIRNNGISSINDNKIVSILQNIAEILLDIQSSNNAISEKDFSPKIVIPRNNTNQNLNFANQKTNLIDSIISGI